jgi:predicted phage terminase large subunit-like protein
MILSKAELTSIQAGLAHLEVDDLAMLEWHLRWKLSARPQQTTPPGAWNIWLILAGRGFGKTRTGAEDIGWYSAKNPGVRCGVIAPTSGDIRGVCFEGESGLMSILPHSIIDNYNRSIGEITLKNGSTIRGFSAEEPSRLRGPQFHRVWCDELAAWQYLDETWDMMMFGLRLGEHPQVVATTTPKPLELIRKLIKESEHRQGKVIVTRGSTYDNAANLAKTFLDQIRQYEGTQLGRQEIHAEVIDPEETGIIKRSWFKLWPASKPLPPLEYIVMSLDTAFTEKSVDRKSHDPDPTACSVWGVFRHEKKPAFLLLDCWEDHLGLPDLIERVKKEYQVRYGDDELKPIIKPLIGPKQSYLTGKAIDLLVIEDKGSGISLRQMLAREDLLAYPYNPGRADKLQRLHAVSHLFAHGHVWVVESDKRPGNPRSWADPLITQLCSFHGEGSIKHDDFVDSTTQALRLLADRNMLSVTKKPAEGRVEAEIKQPLVNPYAI